MSDDAGKLYLVFAGAHYYPGGGSGDLVLVTRDEAAAQAAEAERTKGRLREDWTEILVVDLATLTTESR